MWKCIDFYLIYKIFKYLKILNSKLITKHENKKRFLLSKQFIRN